MWKIAFILITFLKFVYFLKTHYICCQKVALYTFRLLVKSENLFYGASNITFFGKIVWYVNNFQNVQFKNII
jgi:hypothetical protein